ncbi:hypothetical protein CR513_54353, partial [Mucuna pruriens]
MLSHCGNEKSNQFLEGTKTRQKDNIPSEIFVKVDKKSLVKNERFSWTIKYEEVLQQLKELLAIQLILSRLNPNIVILVYLSISNNIISSVLVQEDNTDCDRYTLAKLRYQKIEKEALTLEVTTIFLKSRCDHEIISANKEDSRKAQSSKEDGGLVDSTNRTTREGMVKDPQLAKHWKKVKEIAGAFAEFNLIHVPREQNSLPKLLSKLASTKRPGNNRSVT